MNRKRLYGAAVAAAVLGFAAARADAGGPPWLCVPVDGVTADNAQACARLITAKLGDRIFAGSEQFDALDFRQRDGQWYATFYIREDVGLGDLEAALHGSEFTIPRERLHVFGHVQLQIEGTAAAFSRALAELESQPNVAVEKSADQAGQLVATVNMPYPKVDARHTESDVAAEEFVWGDLSSDQSLRAEPAVTAEKLPSYAALADAVAKGGGKLRDVRWNTEYACRCVGAVATDALPVEDTAKTSVADNK